MGGYSDGHGRTKEGLPRVQGEPAPRPARREGWFRTGHSKRLSLTLLLAALAACGGGEFVDQEPVAVASTPSMLDEGRSTPTSTLDTTLDGRHLGGAQPEAKRSSAVAESTTSGKASAADAPPPMQMQSRAGASASDSFAFSFSLRSPRTTSAGVYSSNGTLVRTLWRGDRFGAGRVTRQWDRLDDQGQPVPPGAYVIRVAHHDVRHVWEGVVGNTSSSGVGARPHKSFQMPTSLAAFGPRMHYSVGYNEHQSALKAFDLASPQAENGGLTLVDPFVGAGMVAADERRLYWANTGGLVKASFVAAFDLSTQRPSVFAAGSPLCLNRFPNSANCYPDQSYGSVLAHRDGSQAMPTGLAVQKHGRLLAVAYGADDEVRLFDKESGQLLRSFPVPLETRGTDQIAFAGNGDLWVLSGSKVLRFTALEQAPAVAATALGFVRPLAIAVNPADDDSVWVADGGSSQQLKRVDRHGALRARIGREGGLGTRATVRDDTLCFSQAPGHEQTAVEVDATGSIWVIDTCNNRVLRFNGMGQLQATLAYLPVVYTSTVDTGDPSRVFANYLEFAVDYGRALSDPRSWTLVRNWLAALTPELRDGDSANGAFGGFRNVVTLGNGRTYAQISVRGRGHIVELRADGTLRTIRELPSPAPDETAAVLYENGDLGWATTRGDRQVVLRQALLRFDSGGDPVWGAQPTPLAAVPTSAETPHHRNGVFGGMRGPRFPRTADGRVVFFNPAVDATSGFHLGAADRGGSAWSWQASPSGPLDGRGAFQTRKHDPHIQYGGNIAMTSGRSIIYGYHGEFYTDLGNGRVGQANQFMHFRDDGLFIGQFGVPSTRAVSNSQAGLSGNAFSPTLVRHARKTYLYHNDESSHGGVHRWQLTGLDDVQDLVWTVRVNTSGAGSANR